MHQPEHTGPACLIEEVNDDVEDEADAVADVGLLILIFRGFERPVDEHGAADEVFPGNEAPKTAVPTVFAIIAHTEIAVGGHYNNIPLDVVGQGDMTLGGESDGVIGWIGWEVDGVAMNAAGRIG